MKSFNMFCSIHKEKDDGMRLGQRFVYMFIRQSWPDLFYADDKKAEGLIINWLLENHHTEELPLILPERKV